MSNTNSNVDNETLPLKGISLQTICILLNEATELMPEKMSNYAIMYIVKHRACGYIK